MADIRKLLQTIDSLSEATLPADHPDWDLPPAERIARQTARIAADSSADANVWNKGLKAPVGDKKFVGDVHHQDEADDVEELTDFEDDSDKIYIGANVFANWDQFGHPMKVTAIVDDQRVKVQDDFGNVEIMFIKDLEAAESDYEPDEDIYPPTSDHAVTESDESLTEEIRAAFEDYVKNKAAPADEKTRVTITYKDGHTQTKSVTEKERRRYETSDSVEKVEDAKGGKGRLDDTKLSEAPQSMKQALDNTLSKVEPGSKMDKKIKHNNDMVRRFGKGTMTTAPSGYHIDKKGLVKLGEGIFDRFKKPTVQAEKIPDPGKYPDRNNLDAWMEQTVAYYKQEHPESVWQLFCPSMFAYIPVRIRVATNQEIARQHLNAYRQLRDANPEAVKIAKQKLTPESVYPDGPNEDYAKESIGEGAEQPTMPIDMKGKKCLRCKKDTYQERSQHDDYQGTVTCSCRHSVPRWKKVDPKSTVDKGVLDEALGDWILTVHDKFGNMIYTNYYNYREQADSAAAPYRKNGNEISITPGKNVSEGKSENRELWDKINSRGVVPSIDRERYTDLSHEGLEGPFRQKNGQVLYYDPRAGQYYNRDTDMYVDQDDFDAMNEGDEMNEAEAPVNAFGVTMDDEYYDKLHSKHNQAAWEEGQALKYQEEERKRRHAEGIPYVRERPQDEIDAWDRHVAKLRAKQGLGESEITELSDKTLSNYKDKAVASIIPTITQKGDIKKAAKHSRGSTLAQSKLDRLAKIRGTLEKLQDAVKEAKSKVTTRLLNKTRETLRCTILNAKPSAMALLPTPGSPNKIGLFFFLRDKICETLSISFSLPTIGSSLFSKADFVMSIPKLSSTGVSVA